MPDYRSNDVATAAYLAQCDSIAWSPEDRYNAASEAGYDGDRMECPYSGERCSRVSCCNEGCDIDLEESGRDFLLREFEVPHGQ